MKNIYRFLRACFLVIFLSGINLIAMAQELVAKEVKQQVNAYILAGDKHLVEHNNIDSARYYFLAAEKLARQHQYQQGIADFISYYISVLNREGEYDEALKLTLESVEICRKLKNDKLLAVAYNNVAEEYNYQGDLKKAAAYYLKALKVAQAIGNVAFQQLFNNNLSSVFLKLNDKDKGYFYSYQSYQLAVQRQDSFGIASSLVNLAVSEKLKKRHQHSIKYLNQVIALGHALKDLSYVLDGYLELAEASMEKNDFDGALKYLNRGRQVLKHYPATDYEFRVYWGLAKVYFLTGAYPAANEYLNRGIQMVLQIEAREELRQMYLLGSEIKEKLRLPYEALNLRKKYEALNDSLLSAENHRSIQQLEIEYQTSQKEKAIAQQQLTIANTQLELQKKNNLVYLSGAAVLVLLFLIIILYLLFRSKQKANAEKMITMQREHEIKVLTAMMEGEEKERTRLARELHDGVGGILSATKMHLSVLRQEQDWSESSSKFDRTVTMLDSASQEIRTISHNLSPDILQHYELDAALANFCRTVSGRALQVDFYSLGEPPRLKSNYKLIIYRMVQELVNNIMKHADASHAMVQLSHHDNILSVTVEDDGAGFVQKEITGIGLLNLQARVRNINGQMNIESAPGSGTTVYLEFDAASFMEAPILLTTAV